MTPLAAGVIGCALMTILLAGAALVAVNVPRIVTAVPVGDLVRAFRRFLALAGVFLIATMLLSVGLIAWVAFSLIR
jgi:hypothetical protein